MPVRIGVSFAATINTSRDLKEASLGCTEHYLLAINKGHAGVMQSIDIVLHQSATVADVLHSYFHARVVKAVRIFILGDNFLIRASPMTITGTSERMEATSQRWPDLLLAIYRN